MSRRWIAVAGVTLTTACAHNPKPPQNPPKQGDEWTYFEFNVDKPATLIPDKSLHLQYPGTKRGGQIRATFVIDTMGTIVANTVHILSTPTAKATMVDGHFIAPPPMDTAFQDTVMSYLARVRYAPATLRGYKVRLLEEALFTFDAPK